MLATVVDHESELFLHIARMRERFRAQLALEKAREWRPGPCVAASGNAPH